jgi:hypothetical protein
MDEKRVTPNEKISDLSQSISEAALIIFKSS